MRNRESRIIGIVLRIVKSDDLPKQPPLALRGSFTFGRYHEKFAAIQTRLCDSSQRVR